MQTWKVEGSKDQHNWTLLSTHTKDTKLDGSHTVGKWDLTSPSQEFFTAFRIMQTDKNSEGNHYLFFQSLELYGTLKC